MLSYHFYRCHPNSLFKSRGMESSSRLTKESFLDSGWTLSLSWTAHVGNSCPNVVLVSMILVLFQISAKSVGSQHGMHA